MADVTFSNFAGIQNTLPPERLHSLPTRDDPSCDLVTALNVDIDNSGQVSRRAGQTLKVAGAAHSLFANGNDCFFVQGGTLQRLNPDFTVTALATGLTLNAPASFLKVNQRIYWSNGLQNGVIDGNNRSWGMRIPDAPGLLTLAQGQLKAGNYQSVVTFTRRDGQESGAGLPSTLLLGEGSGVQVSWAVPMDAQIDQALVYLSEPNGMVLYLAGQVDASAGSLNVTTARLALPLASQWMDKSPAGQCLAYHRGRIFIGSNEFLFGTTALGYEYVDYRDYLALDGTAIAFVIGVEHGLYVGTGKAVYFVSGDKLEDFTYRVVVEGFGIARSAVAVDGFAATANPALAGQQCVLFATAIGICMGMPEGSITHLTQNDYRFTATPSGAAHFRETDTLNQYLLSLPA